MPNTGNDISDAKSPPGERSSAFRVTAEPGQWTTAALRGLPAKGELSVSVKSTGTIKLHLLNEVGYQGLPEMPSPLMSGTTEDDYSFSTRLPTSGDYYLIFDNRSGSQARTLQVAVHAKAPTVAPIGPDDPIIAGNALLTMLEAGLAGMFQFEPLNIRAADCGKAKAVDSEEGIILCTEFSKRVMEATNDREKTSSILVFTLFQAVSRALLIQWNGSEEEERPDEFAVVLMIMLDYQTHVRTHASFFAHDPASERIRQEFLDDERYAPNPGRAQSILAHLDEPALVQQWQGTWMPQMRTELLEKFRSEPTPWFPQETLEQELANRVASSGP